MDTLDYYERYAIPYYEQTIDLDLSEIMQEFVKLLPEDAEVFWAAVPDGIRKLWRNMAFM